jgi:type I restriction enzyme S subunit
MSNWRKVRLGDVAEITMGQSPESEYYNASGDGLPFLQGNRTFGIKYPIFDTYTSLSKKIAKAGDVIMSVRAPVGDVNITPVKMCIGRGLCSLRHREGEQEYLYYLMRNYARSLIKHESGTVFGSVNYADISNLEITIPPLSVQRAIAATLSCLDDKIELNNRINANLEAQAQAIFKSWFVDFEPWGGIMPDGWRKGTISDLGDVVGGSTPSKAKAEYYTERGIAWITPKDLSVKKSKFITHGADDITELGLRNSSARLMPRGTVLFSSRAPIGYIAIASG